MNYNSRRCDTVRVNETTHHATDSIVDATDRRILVVGHRDNDTSREGPLVFRKFSSSCLGTKPPAVATPKPLDS